MMFCFNITHLLLYSKHLSANHSKASGTKRLNLKLMCGLICAFVNI